MRLVTQTPLSSTAPAAETVGATAVVGVESAAARGDHRHEMLGSSPPSTQTFPSTAAGGASGAPARADHVHGMPGSWTALAAGTLGAVSALNITGLTGYRRLHLIVCTDGPGVAGGAPTLQVNGLTDAQYNTQRIQISNATLSGVTSNGGTSFALCGAPTTTGQTLYDILVACNIAGTGAILANWRVTGAAAANVSQSVSAVGFGDYLTGKSDLTAIKIAAFTQTITTGEYVLLGSKDVA